MPFADFALSPALQQVLGELGFTTPTPIQVEALPALLAGRDLRGQARTGSGKTLAFLLPMLDLIGPEPIVQGLVLCPTRELATQVADEARKLARRLPGMRVLVLAGGQPAFPQVRALEGGVHLCVGTPGRVLDLVERGALRLGDVKMVVLDEADRMLEMGFAEEVERIRQELPVGRQTALFSATFPPEMEEAWLHDPVAVRIAGEAEIRSWAIETTDREAMIRRVLRAVQPESALVFCDMKQGADSLAKALALEGHAAAAIHGDLDQVARDEVLACFRTGSVRVLVATDVAARGLDITGLDLVLNADPARSPEGHLHRIGRTGRAGKPGLAITIVSPKQAPRVQPWGVPLGDVPPGSGDVLASPWKTIAFSAGRKDKLRPGDILGALTGEGGLRQDQVGKIVVAEHRAWAAVDTNQARAVSKILADGKVKGRRMWVGVVG